LAYCKNTLIARRQVLLSQAEVINDRINNRNEHDIIVKNDSVLFPHDIVDTYWTMNDGQLALNKYFRNDISTKVFSIFEKDEDVIHPEIEQKNHPTYSRKQSHVDISDDSGE
jgi:hypothetical protein